MIDLYTWLTPNGRKVSLMLEETGLPYRAVPIDIGAGAQFDPAFLTISPNNKVPAIVDQDGPEGRPLALFESATILVYLAEKTGRFLPASGQARWRTLQWLQFQAASLGPMLGQAQHFLHYATQDVPYAKARYRAEAQRLYAVLEAVLAKSAYLAGDDYSIADMATWPWIKPWKLQGVDLSAYPGVARWRTAISGRPAVARERAVLADHQAVRAELSEEARKVLFQGHADAPLGSVVGLKS